MRRPDGFSVAEATRNGEAGPLHQYVVCSCSQKLKHFVLHLSAILLDYRVECHKCDTCALNVSFCLVNLGQPIDAEVDFPRTDVYYGSFGTTPGADVKNGLP